MSACLRIFAVLFLAFHFFKASPAEAQYRRYPPFYYHTYYAYSPFGYGYYNYRYWPVNYWLNPVYSGFSFFPFYNYQPRYATYGALSYSVKEDKGGYAWGFSSRDDAADASTRYCNFDDCEPVAWVQGGCLAMATSKETENLAWGYGSSKSRANKAAIKSCRTSGATDCELRSHVCSF